MDGDNRKLARDYLNSGAADEHVRGLSLRDGVTDGASSGWV